MSHRYVSWERHLSDDPRESAYDIHFIDITLTAPNGSMREICRRIRQSAISDSFIGYVLLHDGSYVMEKSSAIDDDVHRYLSVDLDTMADIITIRIEDEPGDLSRILDYLDTSLGFRATYEL